MGLVEKKKFRHSLGTQTWLLTLFLHLAHGVVSVVVIVVV